MSVTLSVMYGSRHRGKYRRFSRRYDGELPPLKGEAFNFDGAASRGIKGMWIRREEICGSNAR